MDEPGLVTTNSTFSFSYKTTWDHVVGVVSKPLPIIVLASGCFGSIWTIYEASVSSMAITPNRFLPYLAFVSISLAVGIGWQVHRYINACPAGLETVPIEARRIAHIQGTKWEFRFAMSVLAHLLGPTDRECEDILNGKVYVLGQSPRDVREYYSWISARTENLIRMVGVAKQLLIVDYPKALTSTAENSASPKKILDASLAIQRLYTEAVHFERSTLEIFPPDDFKRLHNLQVGWAKPIRDGILQLFQFLQQICDVDHNQDGSLEYTIVFDECPNIDEFCDEFAKIRARLPEIMANDQW